MEHNLLSKIKTPAYIFEEDAFKSRIDAVKKAWNGTGLCFSIKANPFLVSTASRELDYLEVCSPGELEICILKRVDPQKIIFSGVNKTTHSIALAKDYDVRIYTAESLLQAELLNDAFSGDKQKCDTLLRLSAGSQLGMSEEDFISILTDRNKYRNLNIVGIHYFTGTQKKKAADIKKELDFLDDFLKKLYEKYEFSPLRVEYGTGLGVDYFGSDAEETDMTLLEMVSPSINAFREKYPLTVEMGRFFAASCGSFVTSVMDLKEVNGIHYAICDGGINHVKYQGQTMGMQTPDIETSDSDGIQKRLILSDGILKYDKDESKEADDGLIPYCICGSLCTTSDVLARCAKLPELKITDKLIFKKVGAYSVTEGLALFLSRELPAVYVIKNGTLRKKRDVTKLYRFNL